MMEVGAPTSGHPTGRAPHAVAPRRTQAYAKRYHECNPTAFQHADTAYARWPCVPARPPARLSPHSDMLRAIAQLCPCVCHHHAGH
jgi:hypothetical protein